MKHILLIEDDPSIRELLHRFLTAVPYEVTAVGNGKEGVDLLKTNDVDIVLCDYHMPGMSGKDVLSILRADERHENLPFIGLTGDLEFPGADYCITKPFTRNTLLETVSLALNRE